MSGTVETGKHKILRYLVKIPNGKKTVIKVVF
jgi:hypothetical protein